MHNIREELPFQLLSSRRSFQCSNLVVYRSSEQYILASLAVKAKKINSDICIIQIKVEVVIFDKRTHRRLWNEIQRSVGWLQSDQNACFLRQLIPHLVLYFSQICHASLHVWSTHFIWHAQFVANMFDSSHGICKATTSRGKSSILYDSKSGKSALKCLSYGKILWMISKNANTFKIMRILIILKCFVAQQIQARRSGNLSVRCCHHRCHPREIFNYPSTYIHSCFQNYCSNLTPFFT